MYVRVYNDELIRVYAGEDIYSSEVIGKIKGHDPAGFTIRDKDGKIIFYEIEKITAKELQLLIRKSDVATIAIKLTEDEVVEYFYTIAKIELIEHNRESYREDELFEWMNNSIDAGIMHSTVWREVKESVVKMLEENGFGVELESKEIV